MITKLKKFLERVKVAWLVFKNRDRFGNFLIMSSEYNSCGETPSEFESYVSRRMTITSLNVKTGAIVSRRMGTWL